MLKLLDELDASATTYHRVPGGSKFIDQSSTQAGRAPVIQMVFVGMEES